MAGHRQRQVFELAGGEVLVGLGARQRPCTFGHRPVGLAPRVARPFVGLGRLCKRRAQGFVRLAGAGRPGLGHVEIALEPVEPVHLFEPERRGRGRRAGARAQPVPAPQIARAAHQTLPRQQRRLQPGAVFGLDKTDLRHPAAEHRGRAHMCHKRRDPRGQRLRRLVIGQQRPARPLGLDRRRAQIVGQRRAERLFEPGIDPHLVEHLVAGAGVAFEEVGERRHFGPERGDFALGLGPRRPRLGLAGLRLAAGLVGGHQRRLGLFGAGGKPRLRGLGPGEGGARRLQRRSGLVHGHGGTGLFGFAARQRLAVVFEQPLGRLVPRSKPCDLLVEPGQRVLARLGRHQRPTRLLGGIRQPILVALARPGDLAAFPLQPFDGLAGIAVQCFLALGIAHQLRDPALQRLDPVRGLRLLVGKLIARHLEALQDRRRDGFFLAQGRQPVFRLDPRPGRSPRRRLGLRGGFRFVGQHLLGGQPRLVGLLPAPVQEQPLGLPQLRPDRPVARRLLGLASELGELVGELFDHVVDAGEVGLGALELQLRLVAALVQPRDPRRFLEDPAAVLRLGVDQLGDLALAHQRRRGRAGRGVGKQHLHVARAHILGVDLVGAARVAGDPPHHVENVRLVERRRCQPVGVVEQQRDFREIARGPCRGAGKDHVFHPVATHRGRPVLAHHPAQRFEQVGLAAAIRPDHAGQPLGDDQFGRIDEALETIEPEFCEPHAACLST